MKSVLYILAVLLVDGWMDMTKVMVGGTKLFGITNNAGVHNAIRLQ
jgi:hypothetical protein